MKTIVTYKDGTVCKFDADKWEWDLKNNLLDLGKSIPKKTDVVEKHTSRLFSRKVKTTQETVVVSGKKKDVAWIVIDCIESVELTK